MSKTALITGITGQDGSYLAELLISKNYKVYGLVRRTSQQNFSRISHILNKIDLIEGDLIDQASLVNAVSKAQPDEVYNMAAQAFVPTSFAEPSLTQEITGLGPVKVLEAIKIVNPKIKFYQASSSEMFGQPSQSPQNEETPFKPNTPYSIAKLYAHWMTKYFRSAYGIYAVSGILFNHESERRGLEFVTRKITSSVAKISLGMQKELVLGNLEATKDWGYAPDFMEAVYLMMQKDKADDYVIGTGQSRKIKDFVEAAFGVVGIKNWENYVKTDPKFFRPAESVSLVADFAKATKNLGWEPETSFETWVKLMVQEDIKLSRKEKND